MSDLDQFEIVDAGPRPGPRPSVRGPDLSQFEIVDAPSNRAGAALNALGNSAVQFGAGEVEGVLGLAGLLGDVSRYTVGLPQTIAESVTNKIFGREEKPSYSRQMADLSRAITPPPIHENRYARTVGSFVGPGLVTPGLGILRGLASSITGGIGAQAGEDAGGPVGGVLGGLIGASAPSILNALKTLGRSAFVGATPAEIKGSAAKVLQDYTGKTAEEIKTALGSAPPDDLGRLMTTAEVTGNAPMAQIEKQLASHGTRAGEYLDRAAARTQAREGILKGIASGPAMTEEARGSFLMNAVDDVAERMGTKNRARWNAFDRDVPLDIADAQLEIAPLFPDPAAGRALNGEVNNLATQVMEAPEGVLTSGQFQTIRSQALELLRDKTLHNADRKMLAAIAKSADDAAKNGLPVEQYQLWRSARQGTARQAERFAPRTAGGTLQDPRTAPINAFDRALKGDRKSAIELRDAVANDPTAMQVIKKGLIDRIGRDTAGNLTPKKMSDFLEANEGAISEILGKKQHASLLRIAEDLKSQANVQEMANYASKGQSATQQKQTVAGALSNLLETAQIRTGNGLLDRVLTKIKEGAGLSDQTKVQDLLFKAAMEPEFAIILAGTPTETRILSAAEHLAGLSESLALRAPSVSGYLGTGTEGASANSGPSDPKFRNGAIPLQPSRSIGRSQQGQEGTPAARPSPQLLQGQSVQGNVSSLQPAPNPAQNQGIFSRLSDYIVPPAQAAETGAQNMALPDINTQQMPVIMKAIEHVESGGKADAISSKGAVGSHQVTPIAMREVMRKQGIRDDVYSDADLRKLALQPGVSEKYGTAYFQLMLDQFGGDARLALAAYNAGPGLVRSLLVRNKGSTFEDIAKHLPKETREYVPKVERAFNTLVA